MSSFQIFSALAHLGAALPAHLLSIATQVATAVEGGVTPGEAEALAIKISAESGDLKVKVGGVDIVDTVAQNHFAAGFGRVVAALVKTKLG